MGKIKGISFGAYGIAFKVALTIEITIGGHTVTFVNCHLPSGWEEAEAITRAEKIDEIYEKLDLGKSDIAIWSGDFNFRSFYKTDFNNSDSTGTLDVEDVLKMRKKIADEDELKHFEFNKIVRAYGFVDSGFPDKPSFKISKKSTKGIPLYALNRRFSFTDRILYRTNSLSECKCEIEGSLNDEFIGTAVSDHL